jgi:rubrerythrin
VAGTIAKDLTLDDQTNGTSSANRSAVEKGGRSMAMTGDKPGKGTYTCSTCGEQVTLNDATDTLPPCPSCHGMKYHS